MNRELKKWEMQNAYWKIFNVIDTSSKIHLETNAIPVLLERFEIMFGKSFELDNLTNQYKLKLIKTT
jgi:hypothetical protein